MQLIERLKHLPYGTVLAFALAWAFTPSRYFMSDSSVLFEPDLVSIECLVQTCVILALLAAIRFGRATVFGTKFFSVAAVTAFGCILLLNFQSELSEPIRYILAILAEVFAYLVMFKCIALIAKLDTTDALLSIMMWQTVASPLHLMSESQGFDVVGLLFPITVLALFSGFGNQGRIVGTTFASDGPNESDFSKIPVAATEESGNPAVAPPRFRLTKDLPWKLVALDVLLVFHIYAVWTLPVDANLNASHLGALLAGVVILFIIGMSGRLLRMRQLYNASLMLVQGSLLCLAINALVPEFFAARAFAPFFSDAAYVTFAAFLFTVLCVICSRSNVDIVALFGITLIAENLAGAAASQLVPIAAPNGTLALAVITSVAIAIAFTTLASDDDYHTSWGIERVGRKADDPMAYYYSLSDTCASLAMQFSLSKRESDVLLLLAQKKQASEIAEELYVSVATVKTHTSNIYKKLDVHSRKELLEFVNSIRKG